MASTTGQKTPESDCSSCGRFIGPALRCPYCDADAPTRISKIRLRIVAVILAVGGVLLLWISARHHAPPTQPIASLSSSMNFAIIRVEGVICSPVEIRHASGRRDYLSFIFGDGTGTLPVFASGPVVAEVQQKLFDQGKGQPFRITGTVTLSRYGTLKLRLTHLTAIRQAQSITESHARPGTREKTSGT